MSTVAPSGLARALAAAGAITPAALHYFETVGSTNDVALRLAAEGAPAGTIVLADAQTAGRGRHGRAWSSPSGAGVYLSIVGRVTGLAQAPGRVTLGAGVAVVDAIRTATGLPASIKWPNDVVIGAAWRKLGGILAEAQGADVVVIGVGLNVTVASHPPDVQRRAADLETELGRAVDRDALVAALVATLGAWLTSADVLGPGVIDRWRALAADGWEGAEVAWPDGAGLARGVDADGALIVERDGRHERVLAGEVTWTPRR